MMRVWSPVRMALMLEKRRSLASSMVFVRRGETGRAEGGTAGHRASSSPSIPLRRRINSTVSTWRVSFTVSPSVSCRGACLSCRVSWSPRLAESWVDRGLVWYCVFLSSCLRTPQFCLWVWIHDSHFHFRIRRLVLEMLLLLIYFPLRYFTVVVIFFSLEFAHLSHWYHWKKKRIYKSSFSAILLTFSCFFFFLYTFLLSHHRHLSCKDKK